MLLPGSSCSSSEMGTRDVQVVYVGDGNNIVHSWVRLAARLNFEFVCACPTGFEPDAATTELANASGAGRVIISNDPYEVLINVCQPLCSSQNVVALLKQG